MRIVYKDGVPCKVDACGRLIAPKTKPFGGRFQEETITLRVPVSLAPEILKLCNERALQVIAERAAAFSSSYTTPGFENAEVF